MIKNTKLCVSTGTTYVDIDALACMVAFAELNNCAVYSPGPFNATVPQDIRNLPFNFITNFPVNAEQFVIVDTSNPKNFPKIPEDKIKKIYDHHAGFEEYWGNRGQIEVVGACATQIYELFGNTRPSTQVANLLSMAIISNTLNLNDFITTDRDIIALEKLKQFIDMPDNWIQKFYEDTEKVILSDLNAAIKNDIKIVSNNWAIAQLELWNAKSLLQNKNFQATLHTQMKNCSEWFLNMLSVSEDKNYFITNSENIKKQLAENFDAVWDGNIGTTSKLFLRKRILKTLGLK